MIKYQEYINSDEWRNRRKQFFKSRMFKNRCWLCDIKRKRYDVHHLTYKRLGKERISDMVALCRECHVKVHAYHLKNSNMSIRRATHDLKKSVEERKNARIPKERWKKKIWEAKKRKERLDNAEMILGYHISRNQEKLKKMTYRQRCERLKRLREIRNQ